MKRIICFILLLITAPSFLWSQSSDSLEIQDLNREKVHDIYVLARSYGDSIVLRWAVEDPAIWLLSNTYGWQVKTYKVDNPEDQLGVLLNLGRDTLKAMSLEQMKQNFSPDNLMAGVAAQAIYGASVFPTSEQESASFEEYVFRRYQEQGQRQMLAYMASETDPNIADALAMRVVDKDVKVGKSYEYEVVSLIPERVAKVRTTLILVRCEPFVRTEEYLVPPINIQQLDAHRVFLYWPKNKLSGYYIERSQDNGKTWKKMNNAPIYPMIPDEGTSAVYGDSIAELMEDNIVFFDSLGLKIKYEYRVKAFDAFSDYTPYSYSEEFEMLDLIPPFSPILHTVIPKENTTCTLTWTKDVMEDDFKGFVVTFAPTLEGPWEGVSELLGKNERRYVDEDAGKRGRGYYRIFCSDIYGNISYSGVQVNHLEDVTPPAPPVGLRALVDTNGVMMLDWLPNREKDLRGYKVYAANQIDHDFIEVSPGYLHETLFIDTLDIRMLTPHIYYYVVAFDNSHNYSTSSDTLLVKFPDLYPPAPVLLEDYTQDEESVTIRWRKSASEDVQNYFIYRKLENHKRWDCIYIVSPADIGEDGLIVLRDFPDPATYPYQYCVEAVDESRKSSGKNGMFSIFVDGPSVVNVDIDLNAKADKKSLKVLLEWNYEYVSRYDHYGVIYRSVNGGEYVDIHSFKRGETTYTDTKVKSGDKVKYYVRLVLGRGKRSTPSPEVKVSL